MLLPAATCNVTLQQIFMDIIPYLSNLSMVDMFMHIVCVIVFVILPIHKAIDCKFENLWCYC